MIVVSDTSPIINLAIVDQLDLLRQLYSKVIIPQAVYNEIVVEGVGQAGAEEIERAEWIEVKTVTDRPMVTALEADLDVGEAEAIVLALELEADLLLLDERKGRVVAERLGIDHIGILGVLIRAKHEKLVPAVKPIIDGLMNKAGFWIGDELYQRVLHVAGEDGN
jgi:predicted nucleic acid-binding protein